MTVALGLGFPGGRTLAGWWGQLAPFRPRSLWVGHLLLHQVEALASHSQSCPLDPFQLGLLHALQLTAAGSLDALDAQLHLGRQVLARALAELERDGLAQQQSSSWRLTSSGQQALAAGSYPRVRYERRTFVFLAGPDRPPHFLSLNTAAAIPYPAGEDWRFDASALQQSLDQTAEWKEQYGFPRDLSVLPAPSSPLSNGSQPPAWQRVLLDRPAQLAVALVLAPTEPAGERLLGFAARPESWQLLIAEPAFTLAAGWQAPFPELAEEPSVEDWRQAWLAWCQPRNLPVPDAEACPLERLEHRLRVTVRGRLLDKLRSTRSDALRGEAWLLAGEGRLRRAAQIEVVEAKP